MRRKVLCFALSAMLILTFIPQISFADEEVLGTITGFVPLETTEYYYEGDPEESDLTVYLPETLSVYLDGNDQPSDIPVYWEAVEDFNETDFYFYSLKPVWDDSFLLSDSLSEVLDVPWITVYKQEPENTSVEPVVTEDEAEPLYTEEEGSIDPEAADDTAGFSLKELAAGKAGEIIDGITEDAYADTAANTAAIYKYLTGTLGLNTAAACGVMININAESAMSPINLQNTYNAKFGLSDTEYTNAVDKGKGSYKTSSGKSQNFKTDSGGYGLCQWTSSGRKTNLLNKAISANKSVGDMNIQLTHLNNELQSYQQVLTTLRNVPNNAAGAYIAAAEFCLSFEIPANTVNTAASRGKNCLSNYWQTYSGTTASATGTSFISLCGYTYPTAVKVGKGMDVKGYAVSNYKITSVTGTIKNSSGKTLYSKTLKPNTTAYKLSNLDDDMKFGKLSAGKYTYTLSATDSLGKTVTASHSFTAASSGSTTKALGFAMTGMTGSSAADTSQDTPSSAASTTVKKTYSGTFPKLPKRGEFRKGDKGTQVKNLQKFLKWYGYNISTGGKYGAKTVAAVKKFQKSVGLKADGKFGKKSLKKAKKVKK
ncbi:MAG: phage tail tip lysozyme [Bacillota bacterium]